MLIMFSPIFVANTKIIFQYDFVAPLNSIIISSVDLAKFVS